MEYNIWNSSIWRQMSTSVKLILEQFSLVLTVFEMFTVLNVWPWKCRSKSWCTTFTVVPIHGKYLASYLMTIVTFVRSLIIYEIFVNQIKSQKFDLEIEEEARIKTGFAPFDWKYSIRFFFPNFNYATTNVYVKGYSHTHAHTHTDKDDDYRQNLQAICQKTVCANTHACEHVWYNCIK